MPYSLTNQQITIPMAPFNSTGWLAVGGEATLEVTGTDAEDLRWLVRAVGTAQRAAPPSAPNLAGSDRSNPAGCSGWTPFVGSELLVLPAVRVHGFYESSIPEAP